jgi:hypothetical protein
MSTSAMDNGVRWCGTSANTGERLGGRGSFPRTGTRAHDWILGEMFAQPSFLRAIPIVEPAAGYKPIAMSSIAIL